VAIGTAAILVGGAFAIVPMASAPDPATSATVPGTEHLAAPAPAPATKPAPAANPKKPAPATKPAPAANPKKSVAHPQAAGKKIRIDLTGYSWYDNTPAGSAEVSNPIVHHSAGGRGTYADPITVAVPSSKYRPGTRFYLPTVERYVIIEDTGASSASAGADTHLDMWVDGRDGSESAVQQCMDEITGSVPAEVNPPPGRTVLAGPIYSGHTCRVP
jgi:hypothetical protein